MIDPARGRRNHPGPDPESGFAGIAPVATRRRLIFVGGKGGAGKTTIASALGLAMARSFPRRKFQVLSIDPAHSLFDAFGGGSATASHPANLKLCELDSTAVFRQFQQRHREGLNKVAMRGTFLDGRDIEAFLDIGMPGREELSALKAIADLLHDGAVDHLIVDTAPTGHTLRLLALPKIIRQWRDALDRLLEKHRLMAASFARHYSPDESDRLIEELDEMLALLDGILHDSQETMFLPVMTATPLAHGETVRLLEILKPMGMDVPCIVANRMLPLVPGCAQCERRVKSQTPWQWRAELEFDLPLFPVPMLQQEPRGLERLHAIGRSLLSGKPIEFEMPAAPDTVAKRRPHPAPFDHKLRRYLVGCSTHFVCGKGGVGKSTVAAALSLWLTEQDPRTTLLFSTDPAHSLADALQVPIGGEPTPVTDRLDAVQINPEHCLETLRTTFVDEVDEFFDSLFESESVDAMLDREAMQHLLDLTPPGLDELMALSVLNRHFASGNYQRVVIDTAPTGHFLALLQMPELVRAWIRGFFEVLLRYKTLFFAPRVQETLIGLSRDLKALLKQIHDPKVCGVMPVTLPTALSLAETRDLIAALDGMNMAFSCAILNMVTPTGNGCPVCARHHRQCLRYLGRYQKSFPKLPFLALAQQDVAPTGIERLRALGHQCFA